MHRFYELPEDDRIHLFTRLARKALGAYGLEESAVRCIQHGATAVFEIGPPAAGTAHYVLRLCHPDQPLGALQRELLWLSAIRRDTTLEVPEPILARTGDLYRMTSIEGVPGRHAAVLFRWVAGSPADGDLSPEQAFLLGAWIRRLHEHAQGFGWPIEIEPVHAVPHNAEIWLEESLQADDLPREETDVLRCAAEAIRRVIEPLGTGPESAGPIHGRILGQRVLFRGNQVGVVGFASCGWGLYLADVAATRGWLSGRPNGDALCAALLDGYGIEGDLRDASPRILDALEAYRLLQGTARDLVDRRTLPNGRSYRLEQALSRLRAIAENG